MSILKSDPKFHSCLSSEERTVGSEIRYVHPSGGVLLMELAGAVAPRTYLPLEIMTGMERQTLLFIGPVPADGISSLPQGLHPMEWAGAEMKPISHLPQALLRFIEARKNQNCSF